MFTCNPYTEALRDEWDRLALARGTIFHTTSFRKILMHSFGYKCAYHGVFDKDNRICALIPLVVSLNLGLKRAGVALPFVNYTDICADSDEALQFAMASVSALKNKYHLDYLELRLKDQDIASYGWSRQLQHFTFVLSLCSDEDKVLAQSSSSNRNHVRKVYKNNWFEVSFDKNHLAAFYRVYVTRMKELGSPAPDISFFQKVLMNLPENAFLLTVLDRDNNQVVGGMLLLTSPGNQTLYYPYGANLVAYNNKYLNNFMYWEAIRFGIQQGMKYLDLGRSQAGSGTYKYKEQWGAKAQQLKYLVYDGGKAGAGPPDRNNLSMFVELWKVTPSLITDRVGKQLIKYLMP